MRQKKCSGGGAGTVRRYVDCCDSGDLTIKANFDCHIRICYNYVADAVDWHSNWKQHEALEIVSSQVETLDDFYSFLNSARESRFDKRSRALVKFIYVGALRKSRFNSIGCTRQTVQMQACNWKGHASSSNIVAVCCRKTSLPTWSENVRFVTTSNRLAILTPASCRGISM